MLQVVRGATMRCQCEWREGNLGMGEADKVERGAR